MKLLFLVPILFCILILPAQASEEGLNEIGEAFVKAIKANDLEAVVELYATDAYLYPPDQMEAVGQDAIRKAYAALLERFTIQDLVIQDAHHEDYGDLSLGWGRYSLLIVPKAGGDPVRTEGRFSDVSKKIKGKWIYVVDHASVPFLPPPPQTATTK